MEIGAGGEDGLDVGHALQSRLAPAGEFISLAGGAGALGADEGVVEEMIEISLGPIDQVVFVKRIVALGLFLSKRGFDSGLQSARGGREAGELGVLGVEAFVIGADA